MTRYLLAGGGTAGHVNPLLAVADGLRDRDASAEVIVLGTAEGLESRLVPERGYELVTIPKVPFPRRPNGDALRFPRRFHGAVKSIRELIRVRQVDAVVGFGGYAAAPAYRAAHLEKTPLVLHEANAKPGLANILGARWTKQRGVAFPGTPLKGARVVGMPLRREIVELDRRARRAEAAEFFGLDPQRPTMLVFGGSLGARRLNEAVEGAWQDVTDTGWQILHATGARHEPVVSDVAAYRPVPYIDRMELAYALADVVVSRSGAATVSEVSALGLPAVYVPYAVGNGEQRLNAASSVEAGGSILIDDAAFTADAVRRNVLPLLSHPEQLDAMTRSAEATAIRTGTEGVITMIDEAISAQNRE